MLLLSTFSLQVRFSDDGGELLLSTLSLQLLLSDDRELSIEPLLDFELLTVCPCESKLPELLEMELPLFLGVMLLLLLKATLGELRSGEANVDKAKVEVVSIVD